MIFMQDSIRSYSAKLSVAHVAKNVNKVVK